MTVDYERGNFSISQNVWQDGETPQISAIVSPTYANSSSNSTASSPSGPKPIGPGVVAGAVIGGITVLLIAGAIGYYISRKRSRPTSTSLTEDIGLTNLEPGDNKDAKDGSINKDPNSPYPPYEKLDSTGSVHRSAAQPDGELGTQGEIFQLPTHTDEWDYITAIDRMESEQRAEMTPQIDGRGVAYELHGGEPMRVEMDDGRSRRGLVLSPTSASLRSPTATLSPASAGRLIPLPVSRGSSRASSSGPPSDHL